MINAVILCAKSDFRLKKSCHEDTAGQRKPEKINKNVRNRRNSGTTI